jgi:membrane dipeptidase
MKLVDLHQDFAYASQFVDVVSSSSQSNIKVLSRFNCLIFSSIFPHLKVLNERVELLSKGYGKPMYSTAPSFEVLKEQVKFYYYLERKGYIKIIRGLNDLSAEGVKFLISLEGADTLIDPYDLYLLNNLDVRSIALSWNYDNKYAASCMSKKDYGLTGDGEELVKISNKLNLIIDLSHASKRTVMDVCNTSKKPVIASHSNVRKLKDHVRNLDDDEIEAITKTGGIIGVTAITNTLKDKNIKSIAENINYIGNSFGWRCVALGTDFLGIDEVPEGFENIEKVEELIKYIDGNPEDVIWRNAEELIRKFLS